MDGIDRGSAMMGFQRVVVQEILGRIGDAEPPDIGGMDGCDAVAACAGALADAAMGDDAGTWFGRTVRDAVVLYSYAVSAVRWGQCPLSAEDPGMPALLLSRMIESTGGSSLPARTLANEFRLAPYRGPEVLRFREFLVDGEVDFDAWASASGDPDLVRSLQAVCRRG